MQLLIAAIGRLKQGPERELAHHYAGRIDAAGPGVALAPLTIVELAEGRGPSPSLRKADEAERLLSTLGKAQALVVLDETGKPHSSRQFAALLALQRDSGCARLGFVLGGPDGLSPAWRQRATCVLPLGTMTLPHGLARIVVLEQIYRAVTILSGHPYHRD